MPKDATRHVKLDTALANVLKSLAAQRGGLGSHPGPALVAIYQPQVLDLHAAPAAGS